MNTLSTKNKTQLQDEINTAKKQLIALDQLPYTSQTAKNDLRQYYQKEILAREAEIKKRNDEPTGNTSHEPSMPPKSILDIPVEAEVITPNGV